MSISITAQNMDLTPALREYAQKRLGGLAKFTAGEPVVVVEIGKTTEHHHKGDVFEAKVHVTTPLGKEFHAASAKSDMYEAIDDVRTEIVRELTSAKDKKTTLFRRGAQKVKNLLRGFRS
jgi:putative sigma-54 modulation protein